MCEREGGGVKSERPLALSLCLCGCERVFVIENSAFKLRTFCPLKNVHF